MSLSSVGAFAVLLSLGGGAERAELVEPVARIWNEGAHNAFTDLMRFKDRWLCVFREGDGHAKGAGTIRVLDSTDGKKWSALALIAKEGVDLRDPHICLTPDGRLMIVGGAAVPPTRDPVTDHYSFVSFSKDGMDWTAPERVVESWQWLWRVTWHKNKGHGVAYSWDPKKERKYHANLFETDDGKSFKKTTTFDVPQATEATLRFDGDTMICLQRRDGKPNTAFLGSSEPPYVKWSWRDLGVFLGGPNFIQAKGGAWWAVGRIMDKGKPQTALCRLDVKGAKLEPVLTLPSGGDTSYAGLAWNGDELWISYYSSHEGKSSIYLAKVKVK